MHILGTAGHVDHGKSSLVRALTGTDPDRWIEEKLRGLTLDLGFAHLRFEDGVEAGIVDVPGHERFLHNMLAGAAGMELLLLVVAANEGPKPQTIEHLAILSYLNVRRTIIVLTKRDLVDDQTYALAESLVRDVTAGTVAENAPVIGVSTVTGAGLEGLRNTIHAALEDLPPRLPQSPPYLPIDRVFALAGHGTIVTGTLMQGELCVGDSLWLSPLEQSVRVRSLQVFGERRERANGGTRVALNLPGVETSEIHRGAVLAAAHLRPERTFEVSFRPYAPAVRLLRRRMQVRAYVGSAEVLGTLQLADLPARAGAPIAARLSLREPTIGLPGSAFIVRRLSPKDLLGGGTFQGVGADELDEPGRDAGAVLETLHAGGLEGITAATIGAKANLREDLVADILHELIAAGRAYRLEKPEGFVHAGAVDELQTRLTDALHASQAATPWVMGVPSLGLARRLGIAETVLVRILALLASDGRLVSRAGYYATPDFSLHLTAEQEQFFATELSEDKTQQYLPVSLPELIAHMRAAKIVGLSQAFDTLVISGAVVKVGDYVYRAQQLLDMRRRLEDTLLRERQITAAQFRDLIGTSRKYAVPLLEWFDSTGVTVRAGDLRMLRGSPAVSPQ